MGENKITIKQDRKIKDDEILALIKENQPIHIYEIYRLSGKPSGQIYPRIEVLEAKGLIKIKDGFSEKGKPIKLLTLTKKRTPEERAKISEGMKRWHRNLRNEFLV